jgi:hypothetical protein
VGGAMVSGRAGFLYKEEERGERGAGPRRLSSGFKMEWFWGGGAVKEKNVALGRWASSRLEARTRDGAAERSGDCRAGQYHGHVPGCY